MIVREADQAPVDPWSPGGLLHRFTEILEEAERRFGVREAGREILTPEIHMDAPRCMFPGGKILVKLGDTCRGNLRITAYQMAHESVHCLAPVDAGGETVLEEGLAVKFACDFMATTYDGCPNGDHINTDIRAYDDAVRLVRSLLARSGDGGIKALRSVHSRLSPIDASVIVATFPMTPRADAEALAAAFVR